MLLALSCDAMTSSGAKLSLASALLVSWLPLEDRLVDLAADEPKLTTLIYEPDALARRFLNVTGGC
jgi:hypothetical protein